jgi:hypothetical protein
LNEKRLLFAFTLIPLNPPEGGLGGGEILKRTKIMIIRTQQSPLQGFGGKETIIILTF